MGLLSAIKSHVRAIDRDQPVERAILLEAAYVEQFARQRFVLLVTGVFAVIALVLAAIGLYGVIAFGVAQRTREIGVRMALGAQQSEVLWFVMKRGLRLTGIGLAVGIVAALALGRVVAGLLYGVTATDRATLLAVSFLLAIVAMLATYLPARRATRVDPLLALRYE
jgi:ABC-type antimicrobial peptide transport system permease subunit